MRLLEALDRSPLVASVQASPSSPLGDPRHLVALAQASASVGVEVVRLEGLEAIHRVVDATQLPAIGLVKRMFVGSDVYITPTLRDVADLLNTPCEAIAFDATRRLRPDGSSTAAIVAAIHRGKRLAFADCDTIESAYAAQEAGADFVSTTLAGYTEATRGLDPDGPAFATLRQMVEELRVPVVAEGRLKAPWQVQVALQIGAKAVVVGGALNDPVKQTRDFRALVPRSKALLAVDIGGTWTRAALFHGWKLVESWRISTSEVVDRRAWILEQTCDVGVDTVAISSGGTVDPVALEVVEANEIIPGTYVGTTFVLPDANVVALNDGLATAWGHACLPQYAGRRVATLTLGTGLGFGFVANGQIHMGDRGEYARLNDLAGPSGPSFEEVLAGNQRFPPEVRREAAQRAVAAIRNLFFPDAIVLSGGVGLHEDLGLELPSSPFGEDAGLYGAAALALFPPANLPRATRGSL